MHQEDEQNAIDAKRRVTAIEAFKKALKYKTLRDVKWITEAIDQLEIGKLAPKQAIHAYHRKKTKESVHDAWSGEFCFMEEIESYLAAAGMPPKPKQCRLGVFAAHYGGTITFHGPSGTGKTTCAVRAATYAAILNGVESPVISICGTRLGRMKANELSDFIDECAKAQIVILDDIDKGSKSETRASAILEILDTRERNLWGITIVTCNKGGSELADQIESQTTGYGLPIVNRLRRGVVLDFGREIENEEFDKEAIRTKMLKRTADPDWKETIKENFGQFNWRIFGRSI
jgi:hypothetical protein